MIVKTRYCDRCGQEMPENEFKNKRVGDIVLLCGNPAEVVVGRPFSFMPKTPTHRIRCSSEWCIGHSIDLRYQPDLKESAAYAIARWNTRRRKNKLTWNEVE